MSKSILDLMSPEDRDKALERAKRRSEKRKARKGLDIAPEIFNVCEFGYYFGWDAIMAVRRGYTVSPDGEKELLTMDEVETLLEGARKVWYTKLVEQASSNMASTSAAFSRTPTDTLDTQLQPLKDRAALTE